MAKRVYVYKLTVDSGGAPCVNGGLLTLALCKPRIRTSARRGDLIIGFGANGPPMANRLIYIAEVTEEPLVHGSYYENAAYSARGDCIYERASDGQFVRRATARFHNDSDHRERDLGSWPAYQKATVLLSRDFQYLGKEGTVDYVGHYPLTAQLVKGMKRSHRVNYDQTLLGELLSLKSEIWRRYQRMVLGPPTDPKDCRPCNSECPSVSVSC